MLHLEHHAWQVSGDAAQARLAVGQCGLCFTAHAPGFGGAQAALQRRQQPAQVGLEHVVVGAFAHGLDRDVLADLPGDDDERHIQSGGLINVQRFLGAEAGQVVIGNHRIPGPGRKRRAQSGFVIDAMG